MINSGTLKAVRLDRVEKLGPTEPSMKITETEPKILDVLNELTQREPDLPSSRVRNYTRRL